MDNINGVPYDDERMDMDGNYYNGKVSGEDCLTPGRRCSNAQCGDPIYYGLYCSNLCAQADGSDEGMIRFLKEDRDFQRGARRAAELKAATLQAEVEELRAINNMQRATLELLAEREELGL